MHKVNSTKDIIAFIPARIGSKGIHEKNLQKIGKTSLLRRSWDHANRIFPGMRRLLSVDSFQLVREIGVSASQWENLQTGGIVEISEGNYVHKRNPEKAMDRSLIGETLIDVEMQFRVLNISFSHLLMMQPTTPFRCLNDAKILVRDSNQLPESVFSVTSIGHLDVSRIYKINQSKLIAIKENLHLSTRPRQELPELYIRDGGFYLISKENCMIGKPIGNEPEYIIRDFPFNINIDSKKDLELARIIYASEKYREELEID